MLRTRGDCAVTLVRIRPARYADRALYCLYGLRCVYRSCDWRVSCSGRDVCSHSAAAPHCVFVHGDLYWEHIIARENHDGLTGIIDFGDRAIGDPSFDFGELWAYGKKAVEAVYDQYEGPKDASFLVRSLYGYKRVGISAFVNALKGEYGTVEEMYRLFGETVQARYS